MTLASAPALSPRPSPQHRTEAAVWSPPHLPPRSLANSRSPLSRRIYDSPQGRGEGAEAIASGERHATKHVFIYSYICQRQADIFSAIFFTCFMVDRQSALRPQRTRGAAIRSRRLLFKTPRKQIPATSVSHFFERLTLFLHVVQRYFAVLHLYKS